METSWITRWIFNVLIFSSLVNSQSSSIADVSVIDTTTVSVRLNAAGVSEYRFEWTPREGHLLNNGPDAFTLLNLTAGQRYNYTVYSSGDNVTSLELTSGIFYPQPNKVENLRVTMDNWPTTSLRASWRSPSVGHVEEYHVVVSPTTAGLSWAGVIQSQSASLAILSPDHRSVGMRGATPGTVYSLTVYAVSHGRRSMAVTGNHTTYPDAPTLDPFVVDDVSLDISWSPGQGGVTRYSLLVQAEGDAPVSIPVLARTTSITYSNVQPGTFYMIKLMVRFNELVSGASSRNVTTLPSTPVNVTLEQNTTSISLQWEAGLGRYQLFDLRLTDNSQSHVTVVEPRYTYTDLTPGVTYTVTLRSQSGPKQSEPVVLNVTLAPEDPRDLAVAYFDDRNVTVGWMDTRTVGQMFEALIQPTGDNSSIITIANVSGSMADFGDLSPGVGYTVTVRALSVDGTRYSDPGASLNFTTRPLAPISLTQDGLMVDSVALSWSPPTDGLLDSFQVDLVDNRTSRAVYESTVITYSPSVTRYTYTAQGLLPGSTLNTIVSSVRNNVTSQDDAVFFAHTRPLPPISVTAEYVGTDSAEVSWVYPSATESVFDRAKVRTFTVSPHGKMLLAEAAVMSPGSLHEVRGLSPGSVYEVSVKLVSGDLLSEPVSVNFTTKLGLVPGIAAEVNSTAIIVAWNPPNDTMFTHYELTLQTTPARAIQIPKDAKYLLHVFGDLTPGQSYNVSIQTVSEKDRGDISIRMFTTEPEPVRNLLIMARGPTTAEVSFQVQSSSVQDFFEITLLRDDNNQIQLIIPYIDDQQTYTHSFTDLLSGHTYNATISVKSMDRSSLPAHGTVTTVPERPLNVVAVPIPSHPGAVRVTWENPPGITYDYVDILYQANHEPVVPTSQSVLNHRQLGVSTFANKSGLFPGETYNVSVRFVSNNAAGEYARSNVTVPPLSPVPALGFPQYSTNSITLSWHLSTSVSVVDSWYILFKPKEETEYTLRQFLPVSQNYFSQTGLEPGRFYDFRVFAVSGGNDLVLSDSFMSVHENTIPSCDFHIAEDVALTTNDTIALTFTENTSPYFDSYKLCLNSVECADRRELVDKSQWVPNKVLAFRNLLESGAAYHIYRLVKSGEKVALCSGQRDNYIYTRPNSVSSVTPVPTGTSVQLIITRPAGYVREYQIVCSGPNCRSRNVQPSPEELTTHVNFTGLLGNQTYQFSVTVVSGSVTGKEKWSSPYTLAVGTMIGKSSKVRNLTAQQSASEPYRVRLRWLVPKQRNGPLGHFRVRYRRTGVLEPYRFLFVPALKQDEYDTMLGSQSDPLVPGSVYEFLISVNTSAGFSVETRKILSLSTVAPPLSVPESETAPVIGSMDQTSAEITLKNVFSDLYGPVEGYSVIVVELARDVDLTNIKTYEEVYNTSSPWDPYYAIYECDIFATSPSCLPPNPIPQALPPVKAASANGNKVKRSADELANESRVKRLAADGLTNKDRAERAAPISTADLPTEGVTITLGSDSMDDCYRMGKHHCNGPLKPNTEYYFVLRAHNGGGVTYTDTKASDTISTPPVPSPKPSPGVGSHGNSSDLGLVIALPVALLIISSLILVAVLLVRRRRSPKPTTTPSPTYHGSVTLDLSNQIAKMSDKIHVKDFREYVRSMAADSDFGFSESYDEIKPVGRDQPATHSELPVNRAKNRFTNILPYDSTRVKLLSEDDEEGSDYINANFMPGFSSRREFIVTQGPLPSTTDDFWRMMWEQNVKAVVMLTKCVEKGREKCFHYWPHDTDTLLYGDIQCQVKSVNASELWVVTDIQLTKGASTRLIKHFHYTAWPDFGVPTNTAAIIRFVRLVRGEMTSNPGGPLLTHCSAGVGRSGTYIVLDRMLQQIEAKHEYIDIFGTVYDMRKHRMYMVQTEQQYIFLHKAILIELENLEIIGQDNKGFDDDFC